MRKPITRDNTNVSVEHIIPSFDCWKSVFVPLFTTLSFDRCQTINKDYDTIWADYNAFDDKLEVCYFRYKSKYLTETVIINLSDEETALIKEMVTEAVKEATGMSPVGFCTSEHKKY